MTEKNALITLTKKHRLFVEAYAGDVISAMLAAGFEGVPAYLQAKGDELLANPLIQEAIKERSRYMAKTFKNIADREERQALLTAWMRNEDPYRVEEKDANGAPIPRGNLPESMRVKALELLGKSEGDFVDNVHHTGSLTFAELVGKSYEVEDDIEAIEAEYNQVQEQKAKKAIAQTENEMAEKAILGKFF